MLASTLTNAAEQLLEYTRALDAYIATHELPAASFELETLTELPDEVENLRKKAIDLAQDIKRLAQGPRDLLFELLNQFNDLTNLSFIYHHKLPNHVPADGTISYGELSKRTKIDEILLRRMLRFAMINRVFAETAEGLIRHTAASRLLQIEPGAMDAAGYWLEDMLPSVPYVNKALEKYGCSGESNETAFNLAFNTSRPFYLELEHEPQRARRFGSAMRWVSKGGRFDSQHIVKGYDWASFDRPGGLVVDVGGGHGAVVTALAGATQHMTFIVQDLPEQAAAGPKLLAKGLQKRVSFMAHDFFVEQPVKGADVYFFRWILHNWSNKYATQILKQLLPALKENSRIVCCEFLPGDVSTTAWSEKQPYNMDMQQVIGWNSIERTASDWERLFSAVDPRLQFLGTRTPSGCSVSLIEAKWVPVQATNGE